MLPSLSRAYSRPGSCGKVEANDYQHHVLEVCDDLNISEHSNARCYNDDACNEGLNIPASRDFVES
jgi:hypothetical protein